MPEPRSHHFVPAFYLTHFAVPPDRNEGRMHAYDRSTNRSFPSSPNKLARQRDFYRVEVDEDPEGEHDFVVEHAYARLERLCAPVVAAVNARGVLPRDASELRVLLAFVAGQAARTPRVRKMLGSFYDRTGRMLLQTYAGNRAAFEKEFRPELEDEIGTANITQADLDAAYEDHCKLARDKSVRVQMDKTTLIKDALELSPEIEDALALRYWILGVTQGETCFVTTDDPVLLQPATTRRMHPLWSPGFGDDNTNVLMPIGPRYLLMGLPRPTGRARIRLSPREVAEINTDFALAADRFVYSTGPTFAHLAQSSDAVQVVEGPTEFLRVTEPTPSNYDAFGPM